ncbi:hypothetical protein HBI70_035340 [Parastagonospora nodorum]|nr:hypothetical protein HBI74_049700 [Parastagonospora nodorum]KAH5084246.1 hypothetical protein HBH95_033000 [Parastagonospora nodorum]KAH5201459.1 hypothetical protein HBH68_121370 [Parastagonospora nodorum]KAH5285503.1 hypothetical protein HBI70_035340 [Parastagonospora nodorum]KAH5332738.1 hypothetical protein HBI50_046680 [Parastagonospora nodorum]
MCSTDSTAPKYDCDVCGSEFPDTAGVLACEEHFYCNDCAIEVFHRSMIYLNEFPASCCSCSRNGLPPALFTELLGQEFMDEYLLKLSKYYTAEAIRVYCANAQCAKYHHPRVFDDSDHRHTVSPCECGTTTCVGCKAEWQPEHTCLQLDPTHRPAWLPEYTPECRIKQCPQCREWIQLSEACNHMTCTSCQHSFCFICLLPWVSFHLAWGCPAHGDPPEGYDDEGFERSPRGIHLLTGRNREGKNGHEMPNGIGPDSYEDSEDDDADADADVNLFHAHYLAAREEAHTQREALYDHHLAGMNEWIQQRDECLEERDEQIEQLCLYLEAISQALAPETDEHEADPGGLARYQQLLNLLDNEGEADVLVDAEEETEQEDTLDFGLEMMFDDEQTLHDKRHPTVKVLGSATSGMLHCSIAAHVNPFSILDEADEE